MTAAQNHKKGNYMIFWLAGWIFLAVVLHRNSITGWDHSLRQAYNPDLHLVCYGFLILTYTLIFLATIFYSVKYLNFVPIRDIGIVNLAICFVLFFWPTSFYYYSFSIYWPMFGTFIVVIVYLHIRHHITKTMTDA